MKFLRDNGLTIVLTILTVSTIGGMLLTGWSVHNHELAEHGAAKGRSCHLCRVRPFSFVPV